MSKIFGEIFEQNLFYDWLNEVCITFGMIVIESVAVCPFKLFLVCFWIRAEKLAQFSYTDRPHDVALWVFSAAVEYS